MKPAGDWIRKALQSGKSVVTANKLLIAESGNELVELAREGQVKAPRIRGVGRRWHSGDHRNSGGIGWRPAIQNCGRAQWHMQLHPDQDGSDRRLL